MDPRIADYIRENRRRYTRDAITKQLTNAGHHPDEIERVWAALETPDADSQAGEGFWARFALILVGVNVGVFLLVVLTTGMLGAGGTVIAVIFGVVLAIGALIAWGVVAATGPARLRPTTALVVGTLIPLLFALLIGGACYALVGSLGGLGTPAAPPLRGPMEVTLHGPLETDQTTEAICRPNGADPSDGFWVTGSIEAPGGSAEVSLGAWPGQPDLEPTLMISWYTDRQEGNFLWSSDMGVGRPTMDMALDGFDGTVTFADLPAGQEAPDSDIGDPLAGEISWVCEGGTP